MAKSKKEQSTIVLIGGGAAHQYAVRHFANQPQLNAQVICIAPSSIFPDQSRILSHLRRDITFQEAQIDLHSLCIGAGFFFLRDEIETLDLEAKQVNLKSGAPINFDSLSLAIPPMSQPSFETSSEEVIPMHSTADLLAAWRLFQKRISGWDKAAPPKIAIFGDDPLVAEMAFVLHDTVRSKFHDSSIDLLCSGDDFSFSSHERVSALVRQHLQHIGVQFQFAVKPTRFEKGQLSLQNADARNFDFLFWSGGPKPPKWMDPLIDEGVLKVDRFARMRRQKFVLAAGEYTDAYDRETGDATYFSRYAENLLRVAKGQKSFVEVRSKKQRSYFVELSQGKSALITGKRVFQGKWVSWLKRWRQSRPAEVKLSQPPARVSAGEKVIAHSLQVKLEKNLKKVASEHKGFKAEIFSGHVPVKAPNGLVVSENTIEVPDGDFYTWGLEQIQQVGLGILAHGLFPEYYSFEVTLSSDLPRRLSEGFLESLVNSVLKIREAYGMQGVSMRVLRGGRLGLVTRAYAPAKPSMRDQNAESYKTASLILSHPLGSRDVFAMLSKGKGEGIVFDRMSRAQNIYDKRIVKVIKQSNIFSVMDLKQRSVASALLQLQGASVVDLSQVKAYVGARDKGRMKSSLDSIKLPSSKMLKNQDFKMAFEQFLSLQDGGSLLLIVQKDQSEDVVKSLRDKGFFDARSIGELKLDSDAKYRISFQSS